MLCSVFDRIARLERGREVLNVHFSPGETVVNIELLGHRLDIGSPLRGMATKQPTHPLSSQGAHIRLLVLDSFPSNAQGRHQPASGIPLPAWHRPTLALPGRADGIRRTSSPTAA